MGQAVDTVGLSYTAPATATAAYQPLVVKSGDTLSVRNFPQTEHAMLLDIGLQASTINIVRVRSPLFHDNTQGIRILTPESPVEWGLPDNIAQNLYPQDQLIAEVNDQTNLATYTACLINYYSNLPGAAARLHMPAEVQAAALYVKPILVTVSAVAQTWVDTLITATENLLKANTDYALLGYMVSGAVCAVGIKGPDTSNFRICGPGVARTDETPQWFVDISEANNLPLVPVFNSANAGATFCSVLSNTTATITVTLMCVQLRPGLS